MPNEKPTPVSEHRRWLLREHLIRAPDSRINEIALKVLDAYEATLHPIERAPTGSPRAMAEEVLAEQRKRLAQGQTYGAEMNGAPRLAAEVIRLEAEVARLEKWRTEKLYDGETACECDPPLHCECAGCITRRERNEQEDSPDGR